MKCRKIRRPFRFLALGLVGALSLGAVACHFGRGTPEARAEFLVSRAKSKLDLNDTQGAKLDAIKAEWLSFHNEMKGTREQDRAWVKTELMKDKIDVDAAAQLIARRRQALDAKIPVFLARLSDFHASLSPDQKKEVVELIEHFEGHMHE